MTCNQQVVGSIPTVGSTFLPQLPLKIVYHCHTLQNGEKQRFCYKNYNIFTTFFQRLFTSKMGNLDQFQHASAIPPSPGMPVTLIFAPYYRVTEKYTDRHALGAPRIFAIFTAYVVKML